MSNCFLSYAFRLRAQGLAAIAWLALIVVTLMACQPPVPQPVEAPSEGPRQGGRLIYGLTLVVSGIDPHVDASSELGIPLTSVYDTLLYQDSDGSFVPGLAERWEVSDDGLTYTFYLRKDVSFHDGTVFDAEAVKFSFDRIADPETKSRKAASLLGPYERTEVVDDFTVCVRFRQPHAAYLDAASQVYLAMVSPEAVQRWGAEYQEHQVGTGPFMFKEYVPRDHLILERNPDYDWAPEVYRHQGPAYLDSIEFRFFADPASRVLALESGQAHVMGEMPPQDVARLLESPEFDVLRVPIPGQPLQFFVNTDKPPTDDLRVRQALLYAADRDAITQAIFQATSPAAHGPLGAVTLGYDESVVDMYPHDLTKAAALLEEAGWVDSDNDGMRDKDGQPLRLEMILMGWGYVPEVGQMLQSQFREVGVDLRMQEMAFPAALAAAREGKHHLAPMVFSSSDPGILSSAFHSANADAGFNWAKVRDEDLDRLLDAGAQALDEAERLELYAQAQQRIMDLALILPVRDYVNLNGVSVEVKGLRYDRRGWFPWLYDVYLTE
jgi:peptide/nickel transport system substrate-binding protein